MEKEPDLGFGVREDEFEGGVLGKGLLLSNVHLELSYRDEGALKADWIVARCTPELKVHHTAHPSGNEALAKTSYSKGSHLKACYVTHPSATSPSHYVTINDLT